MPVVPSFDRDTPFIDGWRRAAMPGGYESRRFEAQSEDGQIQLTASFTQGCVFDPHYRWRMRAYRARPTRNAPPLPAEYPCVMMSVYRDGNPVAQTYSPFGSEQFEALRNEPRGEGINIQLEGAPCQWSWRGPRWSPGRKVSADLTFSPRQEFAPLAREMEKDHWIIAKARCDVEGRIRVADGSEIKFRGLGYHDHLFGSDPAAPGSNPWITGRVIMQRQTVVFFLRDAASLLIADENGLREFTRPSIFENWDCHSRLALAYPSAINIGEILVLRNPVILEGSAFDLHLEYDAFINGEAARAVCHVVHPDRLRSPILGWILEKSIRRYAANQ